MDCLGNVYFALLSSTVLSNLIPIAALLQSIERLETYWYKVPFSDSEKGKIACNHVQVTLELTTVEQSRLETQLFYLVAQ